MRQPLTSLSILLLTAHTGHITKSAHKVTFKLFIKKQQGLLSEQSIEGKQESKTFQKTASIENLKKYIQSKYNIPIEDQQLKCNRKLLKDKNFQNIKKNETIWIEAKKIQLILCWENEKQPIFVYPHITLGELIDIIKGYEKKYVKKYSSKKELKFKELEFKGSKEEYWDLINLTSKDFYDKEAKKTISDHNIKEFTYIEAVFGKVEKNPETQDKANDSGKEIEVYIQEPGGDLKSIKLNSKDMIKDVKKKIKKQWTRMPQAEGQKLFFSGKLLEEDLMLADYHIKNKNTVKLQPREGYQISKKEDEARNKGTRSDDNKKDDNIRVAWVIIPAATVIVAFGLYLFFKKRKKANKK